MFAKTTKILVVDDMKTVRKLVIMALKEHGYNNITEAANGAEAWGILEHSTDFGIIISDWNMPEMTGIDLLKKVRGAANLAKTPFIMLTAESESQQVLLAVQNKVSNYVVKPFTAQQLMEKFATVYAKMQASAAA